MKRYQTGHKDWRKDQPESPKTSPMQISQIDRKRIVETRKRFELESLAQIGTSDIKWESVKSGFDFPSDRTINRVLKQEGLVKKTSYVPKGVEYPYFIEALDFSNIHQADLVGPRYIKGDGRFSSLNAIDLFGWAGSLILAQKVPAKSGRFVGNR